MRYSEAEKDQEFNRCLSELQVFPLSIRDVYDRAVSYAYNGIPMQISEGKIKRIMVNEIRHDCTKYDEGIRKINKMKRLSEDRKDDTYYYIYKNCTLQKIQEQYEYLKDECERQKTSILMAKRV